MRNFCRLLLSAVLTFDLSQIKNILSVDLNPVSNRRQRHYISRYVRYTKDVLESHYIEVGEYSYGIPHVWPHPGRKLRIGKFCSIGQGVQILLGVNHRMDAVSTYPFRSFIDDWPAAKAQPVDAIFGVSKGDVVIGNDVWIGYGSLILSGVRVGDGAIIGARAVVARDVEPYSIVAGNPARLIRKRFDEETIRRLLEIRWWDWPIEKINENLEAISGKEISRLFQLL